jgi:hypothetical protein
MLQTKELMVASHERCATDYDNLDVVMILKTVVKLPLGEYARS